MEMFLKNKVPICEMEAGFQLACWFVIVFIGAMFTCCFFTPALAAENVPRATLVIHSGAEIDYPPFSMVDQNGKADGFSVELMRAAAAAMGHEVEFRTGPWTEVRGWLERGEIDALPLVGRTPERETLFDFTVPYMSLHGAIVVRGNEKDIREFSDLSGRQVAVMQGDNAQEFLLREKRDFDIHTTPTFEIALQELSNGRYDAVVVQRLVALRLIEKTGLTDLHVIEQPIEGFQQDFCFAVHEGDRETLALLNEGLAIVVADGTYRHLHAKWFAAMQLPTNRPLIVGGDLSFPPFEFLDEENRPAGFNVDLTRAIAQEIGLNIEIRLGRWPERLEALRDGKIDLVQGMFYSPRRDVYFDFSQAHTISHYIAVVRKGNGPAPDSVESLRDKRIIVQRGDIAHDFLLEQGLEKQITLVDEQEAVLRELLADNRQDCALVSRVAALHLIEEHGWNNLELGKRPLLSPEYCYAAAEGQKAILAQFSEGLKVLEKNGEYRRIYDKWLGVYQEEYASFLTVLRYSAFVIIPLLLILMGAFTWSWELRRQVTKKTSALRESEEKYRLLFNTFPLGITVSDSSGNIIESNARAVELLGITTGKDERQRLDGEQWQIIRPDGTLMPVEEWAGVRALQENRLVANAEMGIIKPGGKTTWINVTAAPLLLENYGVVITYNDITERKRVEQSLRESEDWFRTIVEGAPDAVFVQTDQKFAYLNYRALQLFGAKNKTELQGQPVFDRFHPDYHAKVRERIHKVNDERQPVIDNIEYKLLRLDGSEVWGETNGQPIVYQGKNGSLVFIRDITARKQAEEEKERLEGQLQQAQKMESVGRLAGGVAHDFNNMLGVIFGHTEMALEKLTPDMPLYVNLQAIQHAAQRSAALTRQLLAFARKQTVAPKVIDLNETVDEMLNMLHRLIGEDIDLLWQPGQNLQPIKIDPAQIDQLLANLCVNARDAIAGVGKITIETASVTFDENYCIAHHGYLPGEYILLAVSDDGCGMDQETQNYIFEPFFTTKERGKGTGLGLASVFGIIKQNNGFINVYSEPDRGTTFKIYFPPHADKSAGMLEKVPDLPVEHGNETVLLVEDETVILEMTTMMLTRLGYTVVAAATPGEAIRLAHEYRGRIDLLMTDVVMPEMNGRELAGKLLHHFPDLKRLFISGYTANVIAHHGVLDEGVHFIQKPFTMKDLGVKLRETLED